MGLTIHLLGSPRLERGGTPVQAPRGHKSWGLLAYLLRSRVPPSRERLAGLLFPEADDPLGALRWTLSVLRRQLGEGAELGGDPVRLRLAPGAVVDTDVLTRGSWLEAIALPGLGHDLLDGMVFRSSPGFEMWLEDERRHVQGATVAVLQQAALALLARGEVGEAVRQASQLVRLSPYEENAHVLLVRCLRATGDAAAAERQVEICTELFRRDLGVDPTGALLDAGVEVEQPSVRRVAGTTVVLAQLEAGHAALGAGAVETGVQRMRAAVVAARGLDDSGVRARALIALGGALVHSARGTDIEGAAALHEGTRLAEEGHLLEVAAMGWREISWVQFLRAHYERAEQSIARAAELGAESSEEAAWIAMIRGTCRYDLGDHAAAGEELRSAVALASGLDSGQPLALALTFLGRFHLLRGEIEDALHVLDRALDEVTARGMTAFLPWPESFRAEVDLILGDVDAAQGRFEHAFALGCEVGDACWESVALRGLGLVAAARGDVPRALELLTDAPKLCRRLPDTYLWIEAYGLDALCAVGLDHGAEAAPRWIDELEAMCARRGIRELLLRATVYRARLGEPGALLAALSLAAEIENPALEGLMGTAEAAAVAA